MSAMTSNPPRRGPNADRWRQLYARGRERGGVVDVTDADAVELDRRTWQRRLRGEAWARPIPGRDVYLLPGVEPGPRARAAAALRAMGERSVLSHGTAAWVHDLIPNAPSEVHVTVPLDRAPRRPEGVVVARSRTLRVDDVVEVDGLRVTSVARTLREHARAIGDPELLDLLTAAEQRRLVTLDQLVAEAARPGTAAGSGRFRRVVELRRRDRTDSGLERDVAALCRRHGFTPHPGPFPVRCPDGRTVHLDVAFPDVRFALECDGVAFHADARSVQRDRRRWRQIQAAGWRIVWVTRADLLGDPDEIVGHVRDAHAGT